MISKSWLGRFVGGMERCRLSLIHHRDDAGWHWKREGGFHKEFQKFDNSFLIWKSFIFIPPLSRFSLSSGWWFRRKSLEMRKKNFPKLSLLEEFKRRLNCVANGFLIEFLDFLIPHNNQGSHWKLVGIFFRIKFLNLHPQPHVTLHEIPTYNTSPNLHKFNFHSRKSFLIWLRRYSRIFQANALRLAQSFAAVLYR